jgi:LPS export ABC transporter protein LptC
LPTILEAFARVVVGDLPGTRHYRSVMNRVFKRAGIIVLIALFALLIAEVVVISPQSLNEKSKGERGTSEIYNSQDIKALMAGVHYVETKNDEKEWELWAEKAIGFRKEDELALDGVRAIFFARNGVQLVVTGEKGSVEPKTRNMKIEGKVVTKSSNGYLFRTDSVIYNSGTRMMNSPSPVEVAGPRDGNGRSLVISGQNMHADLNKGVMEIADNVRAEKTINAKDRMAVQSEKVQLNGKDRAVRFFGEVTIDMNGLRVTGPDALFRYDANTDLLKSIELDGGVKVSDATKWATSDKLNIFLDEDKYIFNGNPRVVQDSDELRGDQIVFLNGGKKVQVKNAKVKVSRERLEKVN